VKRISMLLAMGLVAGALVLPAAPAHASFAGVAKCDVTLGTWPTTTTLSNATPCAGQAVGVATGSPTACVGASLCTFSASVDHYNETCAGGQLPPLGTADGTLTVNGQDQGSYNWLRVGLTAVLVPLAPGTSAGVAAFVPHPPLPTCDAPGSLLATVVGAAVAP
jgi:hypothetical protein